MADAIDHLRFSANYARKKQIERLEEHLKEGKSIKSFTYESSEFFVDSLIEDINNALKEYRSEKIEATKPFWKKLFKK